MKLKTLTSRTWGNVGYYLSLAGTRNQISAPKLVSHARWLGYLEREFNKNGVRVLELGARAESGAVCRPHFAHAEYIGFDFYAGPNVDVVGDAHRLSSYFNADEKFDLIFSTAVFEHLYMPWVVAHEIQKMLKEGGYVFIETHFSYCSHERPWHFFQFSDAGLRSLFNSALGFQLVDSGMCNPMRGYFSGQADEYLRFRPINELYCHSAILCKKTREVPDFEWSKCSMDDLVEGSRYPLPGEHGAEAFSGCVGRTGRAGATWSRR